MNKPAASDRPAKQPPATGPVSVDSDKPQGEASVPNETASEVAAATGAAASDRPAKQPPAEPDVIPRAAKKPKTGEVRPFAVHLRCDTPLERNPAVILAADEEGAWRRFCGQNGISGSKHEKVITDDPDTVAEYRKAIKNGETPEEQDVDG